MATYRGYEIEKQADGFWLKLSGVYKFEAFPSKDAALNHIDLLHIRISKSRYRDGSNIR